MRHLLAIVSLLGVSACTHVDTGQIDYRVAQPPAVITDTALDSYASHCREVTQDLCAPLNPADLIRRYQPGTSSYNSPFSSSDIYSIEIEQGVIGDNLLEGVVLGREMGRAGQFAILANVFEFAPDAAQAAQRRFLQFGEFGGTSGEAGDVELKLVYFGTDVERHQAFNFSNIPLRPRSAYNGGSIAIQIVIMEVDSSSGPVTSLLRTLARFGQQAVPAPPGVRDVLFDLGESLLSGGSHDDLLFEYRLVLSAPGADRNAVQAAFAPGRYVLRRAQDRTTPMRWEDLVLDHNTARLFRRSGTGNAVTYQPVLNDAYLVLNIRRYAAGTAPEFYAFQDWSEFRQLLQRATDTQGAPLNAVNDDLTEALLNRRSTEWRSRLSLKWAAAEARLRAYTEQLLPTLDDAALTTCTLLPEEQRRASREQAAQDAREALRDFRSIYQAALQTSMTPTNSNTPASEFRAADHQALASAVTRYFIPWASEVKAEWFSDAGAFERAFINDNAPQNLADRAIETADARRSPSISCAELVRRGVATHRVQ
jgi:hypothetical protein